MRVAIHRVVLPTKTLRRRLMSSHAAAATTSNAAANSKFSPSSSPPSTAGPTPPLPIKHSRKQLPSVCTDPLLRQDLTEQILQAPIGSMIPFDENDISDYIADNNNDNAKNKKASLVAWERADAVVQKLEFVLRGYATGIEGTQWNRWVGQEGVAATAAVESNDKKQELRVMMTLVDRLWQEGHVYMQQRASRLDELHGPRSQDLLVASAGDDQDADEDEILELLESGKFDAQDDEDNEEGGELVFDTFEDFQKDVEDFARSEGLSMEGDQTLVMDEGESDPDLQTEEPTSGPDSYMDDFALPGPTVNMYNVLLDAVACQAPYNNSLASPEIASNVFYEIMGRHLLDGGDAHNTNQYTRPNILSFNAPIRVSAMHSYDPKDKRSENIMLRDQAVALAFECFDTVSHTTVANRNSATYAYLLQTVAKYFPPSRIRGNVAHGIWHHACSYGLLDELVSQAHIAANTPSNGERFDEWIKTNLTEKEKKDLPPKWFCNSVVRRFHKREAVY